MQASDIGRNETTIIDTALRSLSSSLFVEKAQLEAHLTTGHFHDWARDSFSRGAYSYVRAGGEGSQKVLGSALEGTLFFAGEATDASGHNGTVHRVSPALSAASKTLNDPCEVKLFETAATSASVFPVLDMWINCLQKKRRAQE
ncbi:MAG: FAD-dependent oxidoreductase [Acidobacteria bacterium]|nr:FAD-dependent oxidoreductase [Acidobacteriota bacterium]